MQIKRKPDAAIRDSSITIGTFDGVHFGHRLIIEKAQAEGKKRQIPSGIITFEPPPYFFFQKKHSPSLLTPLSEKLSLFAEIGVDFVWIIEFNETFANLSALEFLNRIKEEISPKVIVVGYDFRFGKNRVGDVKLLETVKKRYGFELFVLASIKKLGIPVRSTTIREKLLLGDLPLANLLLGRSYLIEGKVIKGSGRGKKLGFPTLNLELKDKNKLLPIDGVYAVYFLPHPPIPNPSFPGVMNIGTRPTFEGTGRHIEVHLLGVKDLKVKPREARVEILKRIRPEKKFLNIEELKKQIKEDIKEAKKVF